MFHVSVPYQQAVTIISHNKYIALVEFNNAISRANSKIALFE